MKNNKILFDNHMHSHFSCDSEEDVEKYIKLAMERGYKEITITDHNELFIEPGGEEEKIGIYYPVKYETQMNEIRVLNKKYEGITIRHGMELGLNVNRQDYFEILDKMDNLDFIIGSIHNPWEIPFAKLHEELTPLEFQEKYYTIMLQAIKELTSAFDVIGHIDFPIRYGPDEFRHLHFPQLKDTIAEIFTFLIENNKGIEINRALLDMGLDYPHPIPDVFKLYKDLGGEIITYGSDSHSIKEFSLDFHKQVQDYAIANGFKTICTFAKRKPIFHNIA